MTKAPPLLIVVMDGVGISHTEFGNAVALAHTPELARLARDGMYRELYAHGTWVGLPSDQDIGNSEVGHNAIGAGRVYDQGAKLVAKSIASGDIFKGATWRELVSYLSETQGTLHLLGLLSDGNVHSHQDHLHALISRAKQEGIRRVRVHCLFDGRDVPEHSSRLYVDRLLTHFQKLRSEDFDPQIASGGGRMHITMDRYEADWAMVERGYLTHVHGDADLVCRSMEEVFAKAGDEATDQHFPSFVLVGEDNEPIGPITDGDGVVFFNFRGDRAIEISKALGEKDGFSAFLRKDHPNIFYAGMMEYDGDLHIPAKYLVEPPLIKGVLSEYLIKHKLRQFACSETQKFGHVTFFWNGNRSGYLDPSLETYTEIPSDNVHFNLKPWMKAYEITNETIQRIEARSFDVARINYANGDMVGHTGDLEASILAVGTVDLMIGRLRKACDKHGVTLLVTADHGNCDEMFNGNAKDYTDWRLGARPPAKTSHTLNKVPLYLYAPKGLSGWAWRPQEAGLGNIAATVVDLLGLPANRDYLPTLLEATR